MYNISWTCFLAALWICVLYNFHFFLRSSENYIPFIEYSWRGEKSKRFIHPNWIKEKWNKHRVHNKFLFYLYCLSKYLLDNLYQHISCFICRLLFVSPSSSTESLCVKQMNFSLDSVFRYLFIYWDYIVQMNIIKLWRCLTSAITNLWSMNFHI